MATELPPPVLRAARTLWEYHLIYEPLSEADLIIGFGSYDLRVADHCAELFQKGLAPRILFTGKSGNWTGNLYESSEAEAFAARAMKLGIPEASILIEPRATNIGENIRFSRAMAGDDIQRVVMVTKPQTQRRVRATAASQWPEIETLVTAPPTRFEDQPTEAYPLENLINELVGDLHRMRIYPPKGYQIAQSIPASVADAFDFLVRKGYHHHL
ncbi:MAG: YdcF family protein [Phyllobacterium sp.]|uniref:YdcF family protein n=1 Tax=Phyllobacterium sp. TaxID=1871046 RepID=UPI0030EFDB1C